MQSLRVLVFLASVPVMAAQPASKGSGYGAVTEAQGETTYLFGQGHVPANAAAPRGGSANGGPVMLAPGRTLPLPEIAAAKSAFEKDRAAILALAGDFRVSFHEIESLGLSPDYKPPQPYHSWATERVHVLEDTGRRISLQHTLVMFFRGAEGEISGPHLTKHWRQDWTYEDTEQHLWHSADHLERRRISAAEAKGTWTHSVFNLEDSPRYEAVGRWEHRGNVSYWTSERAWRPLPRREHSVRNDYDVVEGVHGIVITPTGWVEERKMWKRATEGGKAVEPPVYLAQEIGIDRYERITSPSLAAADEYWAKTHGYWAFVRKAWADQMAKRERFTIRNEVDGRLSYQFHNDYVKRLQAGEPFDAKDAEAYARQTVEKFVMPR